MSEPEVNYEEIINNLEQERDTLRSQLEVSQGNELGMARILIEYLVKERDALRNMLNGNQ